MDIIVLNNNNIELLEKFIELNNSEQFTYYNNRNINILKDHKLTILGILEDEPMAYGHIDLNNNINWIGLCVLEKFHKNGYGKQILKYLLNHINNNEITINFIKDWLELCENYKFLDKSPSTKYKDKEYYRGNDCDNGLFNLCLSKYKIHFTITPDEINLYTSDGKQIAHTNINQKEADWSILNNIPFQIRRMTPKFGY